MNERMLELKKKINQLDELIVERDEAYNEYVKDVETNKAVFMEETLCEVQEQIENEIRNEHRTYESGEIDDRIDDIYSGKCRSLTSYLRYMKLKRDVMLISQMKLAISAHK